MPNKGLKDFAQNEFEVKSFFSFSGVCSTAM